MFARRWLPMLTLALAGNAAGAAALNGFDLARALVPATRGRDVFPLCGSGTAFLKPRAHNARPVARHRVSARLEVRDTVGGRPVTLRFDVAHRTGAVFDASGKEIPSVIAFWFAWYAFHSDTEVFRAG